jgi:hypothetical protein
VDSTLQAGQRTVLSDRRLARFTRDNAWQPPLRTGLLLLRHGAAYVPQMPCFAQIYIYGVVRGVFRQSKTVFIKNRFKNFL